MGSINNSGKFIFVKDQELSKKLKEAGFSYIKGKHYATETEYDIYLNTEELQEYINRGDI